MDLKAIQIRHFERRDYSAYRHWFSDAELNTQLGPMDEQWLEHVLADKTGSQFSCLYQDELVAVAGICHPRKPNYYYGLTDIAIRPDLRKNGIASEVLPKLLTRFEGSQNDIWRAFIAPDNLAAIGLFKKLGWVEIVSTPTESQMRVFQFG